MQNTSQHGDKDTPEPQATNATNGTKGFRFRLGLTLAALPVLVLLLTLGTWQVQRHFWKQDLIANAKINISDGDSTDDGIASVLQTAAADIQNGQLAPSSAFAALPPNRWLDDFYRQATTLTGTIDPAMFKFIGSARIEGIPGKNLYGFLDVTGPEQHQGYWTRLGFVAANNEQRVRSIATQHVTLDVVLRAEGWRGASWLKPANDPNRDLWAYVNIAELNDQAGVNALEGFYLHTLGGTAIPHVTFMDPTSEVPNNHWHYALTWYTLALVLVTIWFLMSRQPVGASKQEDETA